MRYDFDLIVIGSGAGGNVGAFTAAELGKKVAVVEKGIIGGECPNFACVPTKALLHAANVFDTVKQADQFGTKAKSVSLDYKMVRRWKNLVVSRTGTSHGEQAFHERRITLIKGTAKFISPSEISVGTKRYTAEKFIIATGSHVAVPSIPGMETTGYITFNEAGDFDRPPKSIFILGGGAVGCEYAQIFSSFGSRVILADNLPRLLAREDQEVGDLVQALFENRGITVLLGATVTKVAKQGEKKVIHYQKDGEEHTVSAEKILIATGKKPNVDLDLERAGVAYNKQGIRVNKYLQTTVPNIFAAGDVAGPYLFTHTGEYQSEIAAHNAFAYKKVKVDYSVVPRAVFLNPEVASVGLTEQEAKEQHIRIKKGLIPFSALGGRANTDNNFDGFVKVITALNGTLLGGSMVGPRAGEVIHELALALKFRAKAEDIATMIHAYPTYSEALKLACVSVE